MTTSYDYSVPFETEITVTDGTLSQTTIRTVDLAGRLVSEETANGTGDLKTMYEYGFTPQGGRNVAIYANYPTNASAGTAGVRDRVTAYYRDGQMKSVTGSAVVAEYHHHDAASGERSTLVSQVTNVTGSPGAGDRYTKTTYDMLGRMKSEQRPGWIASGTATLTTTYHYDASGDDADLLKRVQRSHAADTLYAYDALSNPIYTALDADDDATIDYAGSDRVTHTETQHEFLDSAWWRVSLRWVLPTSGDDDEVLVSEVREKAATYLASGTIREMNSFDASGNVTVTTTELLSNHLMAEETNTPGSATDEQRVWHGDRLMLEVTSEGVTTEYVYDGLGRRTHVIDSRDNTTEMHYDAAGRIDWSEDEAEQCCVRRRT